MMKAKQMKRNSLKTVCMFAAALTLPVVLTGCAKSMQTLPTYNQIHKLTVAETVERMELYVRPQGLDLSARDRSAMQGFVNLYANEGDGGMYLNVPSNAAGAPGMTQARAEIQNLLLRSGLSSTPLQTGQYQVPPNAPAPLVLSFRRLAMQPINCGLSGDLTRTSNNQAYYNFGCANQANFAAMIGDPRQLIEPYAATSPNATRRTIGFDKYVEGTDPSSEQPSRQAVSAAEGVSGN